MTEFEQPGIRVVREELQTDFEALNEDTRELALSYLASWRSRFGDSPAIDSQEYPALMQTDVLYRVSSSQPEAFSLTYVRSEDESVQYDFADGELIVDSGEQDSGMTDDPESIQRHWGVLSGALYDCDASERERQATH